MNEQQAHILDCAQQLLKTSGYKRFSMSQVADACDIDVHSLHAHFESETLLLTTLATSFSESYCAYFESCQIASSGHLEQDLNLWLVHLLEYRETEGSDILFKEFWAIALHDQQVRLVLDQYYRQLQHIIVSKLQAVAPTECPQQKIASAGSFLLPFVEGYSVMRSTLPTSLLLLSEQLSKALQAILQEK